MEVTFPRKMSHIGEVMQSLLFFQIRGVVLAGTAILAAGFGRLHARGESVTMHSPDRRWSVTVDFAPREVPHEAARWSIRFEETSRQLMEGRMGLELLEPRVSLTRLMLRDYKITRHYEQYVVPCGKSNPVRNHYLESTIEVEPASSDLRLHLVFRLYNDGLAFRYRIPQQPGLTNVILHAEHSEFIPEGDPMVWPMLLEGFGGSHEAEYQSLRFSEIGPGRLMDLPLLMHLESGKYLAVTEAAVKDYAGMILSKEEREGVAALRSRLAPWPDEPEVAVRSPHSMESPWRVLMFGDDLAALVESNLILNLNKPPRDGATDWIRPGMTTWHWWNGTAPSDPPFTPGMNFETMKYYIDFCAAHNIPFHALTAVDGRPWYWQPQPGLAPGPETDILTPRSELRWPELLEYARERGVALRLWVHWLPLSQQLDAAMKQYAEWGIAGLMVDFLDRDDQAMMKFYHEVLQATQKYRLHVQFHGVAKPTGWRRTYPQLMNHEGVLNLEYLKWSARCTPEHNVTVPFTRMLAGPMDYHLGGFRAAFPDQFEIRMKNPMVLGTRAHHIAAYVVYENPRPMVADSPEAYAHQAGFDFLTRLPTQWNESRLLQGSVGNFIVMARRHESTWYVGCMTDWCGRDLSIDLSFLPQGECIAEIYADDVNSEDPNAMIHEFRVVNRSDSLPVRLQSGGGCILKIAPMASKVRRILRPGEDSMNGSYQTFTP